MPPRKNQKKVVPKFPEATQAFKFNTGFHYQKDTPPMLDQIPIPTGSNGCLSGINFVVTGTMPSLTRDQVKDLIEKYGGKLSSSISGKTDVVIRGCQEVGPKKIQEAQSRGIQITDQEGLFTFIANSNPQYKTNNSVATAPPPPPPPVPAQVLTPEAKAKKVNNEPPKESSEEQNAAAILANLPEAKTPFKYFIGYHPGIGENPPLHNQIPIPVGANGCLRGLTLLSTGQMPSLTSSELKDIIEKYNGKLAKSFTKKVNIVIRGCEDVSESKISEATKKNIPIIDQYGFFQIIERSKTQKAKQDIPQAESTPTTESASPVSDSTTLFSEKYRPRSLKEICGNIGAINQLSTWIYNFIKPKSNASKSEDKSENNSTPVIKPIALVSGTTGIGKTTAVNLVCKEHGFTTTEFNASDSRSKRFIESIKATTSNLSFNETDTSALNVRKHAIIFEDLEDMSRNYSNLIELAQNSKIPIICICNDADNAKLETLSKSSLQVRFYPPKADEIKSRLRFICNSEGITNITDEDLDDIIKASKNDVRFAINSIQYWGNWNSKSKESAIKDETISDVIQASLTILNTEKTLTNKFDAFFYDYSQVPLYVQQNLPLPMKYDEKKCSLENFHNYADALDSICYGDIIDNCIRENQTYELLNAQAVTSSIYPSELVQANLVSVLMPKLYKSTKKQQKFQRYIQEIGGRTTTFSDQPKAEIYDTFSSLLSKKAESLLTKTKTKDYSQLLSFTDSLGLSIEDIEHAFEIITYGEKASKKSGNKIEPFMKELTKEYKKRHSDDPKKISSERDFRALYNVRQTKGKAKSIK